MKNRFIVVLTVCILAISAAVYLYLQLNTVNEKLVTTEQEKSNIAAQLRQSQKQKSALAEEVAAEKQRAEAIQQQVAELQDKLYKSEAAVAELKLTLQQNATLVEESETIKQQLAEAVAAREKLENELDQTVTQYKQQLDELRKQKLDLERRLQEQTGEIPGAVRIEDVKIFTGKKFSGKVLAINRKYQFVIVNIGKNDGLEQGTVLIVHRGKKFIGKVKVERLYNKMSAANLLKEWMQDDVKPGDEVKKF